MKDLCHLGKRICIIGPSSSGKSTLAVKLGEALGVPHLHLDQIAHRHGSNWERVPNEEFIAAHDDFIARDGWVIEGNYSICVPQRFARASTVIWLDPPLAGCIWRYIKRTLIDDKKRAGGLPGTQEKFNPELIRYTLQNYPKNRLKYQAFLDAEPDLPRMAFRRLVDLEDLK